VHDARACLASPAGDALCAAGHFRRRDDVAEPRAKHERGAIHCRTPFLEGDVGRAGDGVELDLEGHLGDADRLLALRVVDDLDRLMSMRFAAVTALLMSATSARRTSS
jgi:hypothetical protein